MIEPTLLHPSLDAKTKFKPCQRNTFGLLPGPEGSCPGATNGQGGCWKSCRRTTCYAWRLMRYRPNIEAVLRHNFELLSKCKGASRVKLLVNEFKRFLYDGTAGDKFYRLHWAGDIFSVDYARDLMKAIAEVPNIKFWNYTRSLDTQIVDAIVKHKPSNLVQYISADAINLDEALAVYDRHPETFSMSYMGDTLQSFQKKWAKRGKIYQCPSNFKHDGVEYQCKKCKNCLGGKCIYFRTRR